MRVHKIDRARLLRHNRAFNASICRHGEKIFMAYRVEDHGSKSWAQIALCELDKDWQPIMETNRLLSLPEPAPGTNHFEDPRLYPVADGIVLTFIAARFNNKLHVAAQGICRLNHELTDVNQTTISYPTIGSNLNYASTGNDNLLKSEKNWTLLSEGRILYSINPTSVFKDGSKLPKSRPVIEWNHGTISGSTQLTRWGENLLGCFHSFVMREGHRHYCAGWYVFDPQSLKVAAFSKEPILVARLDEDDLRPDDAAWRPRVIFPCGLMETGDEFALSYGWLDSTIRIAFFSKEEIKDNLQPVTAWQREAEIIRNPWGGIPGGFNCELRGHKFRAHSWPRLLKIVKQKLPDISESEIHFYFCLKIDNHYKTLGWVEEKT